MRGHLAGINRYPRFGHVFYNYHSREFPLVSRRPSKPINKAEAEVVPLDRMPLRLNRRAGRSS